MEGLKIITFNCQGLQKDAKRGKVFHWLKELGADIILLQETHCCINTIKGWLSEWKGHILYSIGETNARGCCILFREQLTFRVVKELADPNGRYIICDLEIDSKLLTLINTYGPNRDDDSYFSNIYELCEQFTCENIIWGGTLMWYKTRL